MSEEKSKSQMVIVTMIIGFGILWFVLSGFSNPMIIFYSLIAVLFVAMAMRYTNKKRDRMDKPMQQNVMDKPMQQNVMDKPMQQNVYIQGDNITKTEVKDSVLNRSNIGSDGKTKAEQIQNIKELLDSGAIDKDDYEKMKREIIG